MKVSRSLIAHAVLAIGSMIAAYLVWTGDTSTLGDDEVVIVECDSSDLSEVRLELENKTVVLEVRRDDEDSVSGFLHRDPAARGRRREHDAVRGVRSAERLLGSADPAGRRANRWESSRGTSSSRSG